MIRLRPCSFTIFALVQSSIWLGSATSAGAANKESVVEGIVTEDVTPVARPKSEAGRKVSATSDVATVPTSGLRERGLISLGSGLSNPSLSLAFADVPLSQIFRIISQETGINFVVSESVGARIVSLNLRSVALNEVLASLASTEGLGIVASGQNVVRVDLAQNLQPTGEEQKTQIEDSKGTLVIRLNHGRAKDIAVAVQNLLQRSGNEDEARIRVAHDERINAVIVDGAPSLLARARAIVERMDVAVPQVEIATRIVEVQKSDSDFTGVSWDGANNFDPGRGLGLGSMIFPNSITAPFAIDTGGPVGGGADLRLRLGSLNDALDLDLRLRLQQTRGEAEILQSGKVIVQDGGTAKISAGSILYVRAVESAGGSPAGKLDEIKMNLTLEVGIDGAAEKKGVSISRDGVVRIPVRLRSAVPGESSSSSVLSADNREIETEVVKRNGETAVIGGIYNTVKRKVQSGVPILSKIPIFGALFRSTSERLSQTELIIMLTPRIVDPLENKDVAIKDLEALPNGESDEQTPFPPDSLRKEFRKSRRSLKL